MPPYDSDLLFVQELDANDELKEFRERFVVADPELIYVDGNSLGRLPVETVHLMEELVGEKWGRRLIRGWNEGWYEMPERIGAKVAGIAGARNEEVILADSTSVTLFKLVLAAARLRPDRSKIITDSLNFPSDLYILQGVVDLLGENFQLIVVPSLDGVMADVEAIKDALDEDTLLLTLSHTAFKSGFTYDMAVLTELAHQVGALVLWDTSHSIGAIPIDFNGSNVDLAIGCTYKYLNGGPGSPAFMFVNKDLHEEIRNPISGWMGQRHPFEFALEYEPEVSLRRMLSGTPPILSLAAAEIGIDLILEAGITKIRAKSIQQTEYFIHLWKTNLKELGYLLRSPREPSQRGSHVTLGHPEGWRINQALIHEKKVIPDFRQPDNIRFGFAPLYNSFGDVKGAADSLIDVVEKKLYKKYEQLKPAVT
ncbi:MAG: kynureninase [Candidatus Promineifilaceae bacterium]